MLVRVVLVLWMLFCKFFVVGVICIIIVWGGGRGGFFTTKRDGRV